MVKGNEFHRRNNNQGAPHNREQRNQLEHGSRENTQERKEWNNRNQHRESMPRESASRENAPRQAYSNNSSFQNAQPRISRVKTEETVDDIKADIVRIEKEIQLEIKEIKSMRLGL